MRLTRYLPWAWWRKRHCPEEPESWEFSPQSDVLLTVSGLWPKSHWHFTEVGPKQEQNLPREPACWEDSTAIRYGILSGRQTTNNSYNKLQYAYQGLTKKRASIFPRASWHRSQAWGSWISPVSRGSVRYSIVSLEMFSAVQGQLHNASGLWIVEQLFIQTLCDLKKKKKKSHQTGVLLCFTKAVLCWLQVQDSWAIRRGKMDSVLACVDKENRHSWEWRPQQVASVRDTYLASS